MAMSTSSFGHWLWGLQNTCLGETPSPPNLSPHLPLSTRFLILIKRILKLTLVSSSVLKSVPSLFSTNSVASNLDRKVKSPPAVFLNLSPFWRDYASRCVFICVSAYILHVCLMSLPFSLCKMNTSLCVLQISYFHTCSTNYSVSPCLFNSSLLSDFLLNK